LLSPQPVEVQPLAESALALVQPDLQQTIRMDIPAGLWVYADQDRLRQVMTNLLTNAGKYSPASSPIDFRARVEPHFVPPETQAEPASYLVISVVDRGDGITPEDQKKLFQKFVRLQRSLTTPVRGTGLGLYICRQYLTAMGGAIWVESTLGKGSTFRFALPLLPPPGDAAGNGKASSHPNG
jgi:signal transduction histidine kinase